MDLSAQEGHKTDTSTDPAYDGRWQAIDETVE